MQPEPFEIVSGNIAALPAANIDTDVIMPKTFLKGIDRSGLARGVFHDLRFDAKGEPKPDFVLNQPEWQGSSFLVTGPNFGCGSSREHAVWGLLQLGIRAIIASSFSGIFFDNCARNGLLAIESSEAVIQHLIECAQQAQRITIDLPSQQIITAEQNLAFDITQQRKMMLVRGLDAVGMTLQSRKDIEAFQDRYLAERPWLS